MATTVSKRTTLLIASVASFLTPFLGSSVNIALPSIGEHFSMDALSLSWVTTSYYLSAAVFLVPLGRLADIKGRKKVFILGTALYTLSSLLAAAATSGLMLITLRALQGFGSAMIFGTGVAILTSVFPPEERGKALGINVMATYVGLSLGPFLGGALTQHFGWQSIFLVNAPIGLALMALTLGKLKGEWAEARGDPFDILGSAIYGLALVLIMYGISQLPAPKALWFILPGIAGFLIFIWWEGKVRSPVLNIRLFRENPAFTFPNLAALANYSATHAIIFLLSLYLQNIKGLSPQQAGLILLAQPLTQVIFSPFTGRLSDRIQPRIVASIGMAFTFVAVLLFTLLSQETSLSLIVANLSLLGLGLAFFSAPNSNAIMGAVEKRFYGVASGTLGTMRLSGQILSMGIVMLSFAVYMGRVKITPKDYLLFLRSAKMAFEIFGVLSFGGILASMAGGKGKSDLTADSK